MAITRVRLHENKETGRKTTYFNVGDAVYGIDGDHTSAEATAQLAKDLEADKFEQGGVFEPADRKVENGPRKGTPFVSAATTMLRPKLTDKMKAINEKFLGQLYDTIALRDANKESGQPEPERLSIGQQQRAEIAKRKEAILAKQQKAAEEASKPAAEPVVIKADESKQPAEMAGA